jgi:hypothetical protein
MLGLRLTSMRAIESLINVIHKISVYSLDLMRFLLYREIITLRQFVAFNLIS